MVRIAIMLLALAGCLRSAAFPCSQDSECVRAGEPGVCESTGFCSFADGSCEGGRRYGDLSGKFAGQCVGGNVPGDGSNGDSPVTGDGPIDMPTSAPFCDATNEPTLVGCWEFENTLADASGDGNDGAGTNVSFAAGKVGMGAVLAANSHIALTETASLAPPNITIEGWINPTALPGAGTRFGVMDNDGTYGVFLQNGGMLCTLNGALQVTVAITPGVFTHVACTTDGTTVRAYVGGTEVGTLAALGPLAGLDGSTIALAGNAPSADTLVGMIDQMRVWNVARAADDICRAAGRTPPCT
jgi:hypothetical protein